MAATLKVLYIIAAGVGVFFINNIWVLLGVLGFHSLLLAFVPKPQKALKALWKVKWFVLIIFLFHALSFTEGISLLKLKKWVLYLNEAGALEGAIMACKLLSMLLITQVVRLSMSKEAFIKGMTSLGLPHSSASIIDQIMDIVTAEKSARGGSGSGSGGGKGKGKRKHAAADEEDAGVASKEVLFKGKVGNLPRRLLKRIDFARDQFKNNPNAIVASTALSVTLIRLVKIAPGLPLAPGHKNILLIPVMVQGILRAKKKFTGTQVGFISGLLHFSMGFGKYGPLGILQFALMGWVLDVLLRIPSNPNRIGYLMFVGGMAGLTRISSEILLAFILGMPNAFFLLYLPYIISQVAFGAASGFVTKALLKKSAHE